MKNKDINLSDLSLKKLGPQLGAQVRKLNRYAGLLFFLLTAAVYGFVLLRITSLSNVQPSDGEVSSQSAPVVIPKVDPEVVKQLESLKDNSSNVQSLFEEARENPFQE